jgi:hypothetical protein
LLWFFRHKWLKENHAAEYNLGKSVKSSAYLWQMKISCKLLVAFSLLIAGLLVTGFYYDRPCRHNASISVEKMGVFYIGVDNPVIISACGVAPTDIKAVLSNDGYNTITPTQRPGSYIVRVGGGTQIDINTIMNDELKTSLGTFRFRIKRVPDPVAYFGSLKADGFMTKAELMSQSGIFARMENFDFDLKFTVLSFEMSFLVDGAWKDYHANGPGITPEMKTAMGNIKPGDRVIIQKVTVKGPDGTMRKIPGIVVKVK